jgi:hypothetical protein
MAAGSRDVVAALEGVGTVQLWLDVAAVANGRDL